MEFIFFKSAHVDIISCLEDKLSKTMLHVVAELSHVHSAILFVIHDSFAMLDAVFRLYFLDFVRLLILILRLLILFVFVFLVLFPIITFVILVFLLLVLIFRVKYFENSSIVKILICLDSETFQWRQHFFNFLHI